MDIELRETIEIDAPAHLTWGVVADYGRDPEWRQGCRTMGAEGEVHVGMTTDEVLRTGGRTYRNGGVVTAVEPGAWFTWRTTSGVDADGRRTVEALGEGRSRLTLELRLRPHGVERVLAPVLRPVLRKGLAGDARRLAGLVSALAEVRLG